MPTKQLRQLPRLQPEWYRGKAFAFWTYTFEQRAQGWLNSDFYVKFREIMLHALIRHNLSCPIYTLMPDHIHFIWIGASSRSDQLKANMWFRTYLRSLLEPARLQRQAHDHVLREEERKDDRLLDTVRYISDNPVRADLVTKSNEWPFSGAMIPGFPNLAEHTEDFWPTFWKCYHRCAESSNIRCEADE